MKSARDKLNSAYVVWFMIIALVTGLVLESWWLVIIIGASLVIAGINSGSLRFGSKSGDRRR